MGGADWDCKVCILQIYFHHPIAPLEYVLYQMDSFHLEVFPVDELVQVPRSIIGLMVPPFFGTKNIREMKLLPGTSLWTMDTASFSIRVAISFYFMLCFICGSSGARP